MYELYNILELSIDCTKQDIRKSYLKLSKIYHPDKSNSNPNKFNQIKNAYEILYNEKSKYLYDTQEKNKLYNNNINKINDLATILFNISINNFLNKINY